MNTALTTAVLQDCATSLVTNTYFQTPSYKDDCFCKKNLEYVIRQIHAEETAKARHAVAEHYASIILENNAREPRGCPHKHTWVTHNMEKHIGRIYEE